jgi:hypothetical protein
VDIYIFSQSAQVVRRNYLTVYLILKILKEVIIIRRNMLKWFLLLWIHTRMFSGNWFLPICKICLMANTNQIRGHTCNMHIRPLWQHSHNVLPFLWRYKKLIHYLSNSCIVLHFCLSYQIGSTKYLIVRHRKYKCNYGVHFGNVFAMSFKITYI